ncbi:asparaginase, partial [Salmonella enterica]|uniref:asparaginase n=1 Tax=Salmonella enterica TaxID=28901 RepID=UPI003D280F90
IGVSIVSPCMLPEAPGSDVKMPPSPQFDDLILVSATRWVQGAGEAASQAFESRVENRHLGWLIVTDEHQNLLHCTPGAAETATFFRSSAKPFQAFP